MNTTERDWMSFSTFTFGEGAATRLYAPQSDILVRDLARPLKITANVFSRSANVLWGIESSASLSGRWTTFIDDMGSGESPGAGANQMVMVVDPRLNPMLGQGSRLFRWFIDVPTVGAGQTKLLSAQLRVDDACDCGPSFEVTTAGALASPIANLRLSANADLLRRRPLGLTDTMARSTLPLGPSVDLLPWTSLHGTMATSSSPVLLPIDAPFDTNGLCSLLLNLETLYASNATVALETSHTLEGDRTGAWVALSAPAAVMGGTYVLSKQPHVLIDAGNLQVQLLRRYLRIKVTSTATPWKLCLRAQMTVCG